MSFKKFLTSKQSSKKESSSQKTFKCDFKRVEKDNNERCNETYKTDNFSVSDYQKFRDLEQILKQYLKYKEEQNGPQSQKLKDIRLVLEGVRNERWDSQDDKSNFDFELNQFYESKKCKSVDSIFEKRKYIDLRKTIESKRWFLSSIKKKRNKIFVTRKKIRKKETKKLRKKKGFKSDKKAIEDKSSSRIYLPICNFQNSILKDFYFQIDKEKQKMLKFKNGINLNDFPGISHPIFKFNRLNTFEKESISKNQ